MTNETPYLPEKTNCNGVTVDFYFLFKILNEDDIQVILEDSSGVQTVLTLATDYTVTFVPDIDGGKITTVQTYASGNKIIRARSRAYKQGVSIDTSAGFQADVVEKNIADSLSMQIQQINYDAGLRAVKTAIGSGLSLIMPTPQVGYSIGWDSLGTGLVNIANLLGITVVTSGLVTGDLLKYNATSGLLEKASDDNIIGSAGKFLKINSGEDGIEYGEVTIPLPTSLINGLLPSNNVTDANKDIDISVGKARDSSDTVDIVLASIITKQIDANWVAGDDAGGFPSGLTLAIDTWYHLFVIYNPTTDTTDVGFDTSITATNLLADATGYTKYRRIGSVLTDGSSNILAFKCFRSGNLLRTEYVTIINELTTTAAATAADLVLSVPPTNDVRAMIAVEYKGASGTTTLNLIDKITTVSRRCLYNLTTNAATAPNILINTDTSQIQYTIVKSGTITDLQINLYGYEEIL